MRLVRIVDLRASGGLIEGVHSTPHVFERAPKFALFSYRQADVGLGEQRLSQRDILAACDTAEQKGCSHVWLDVLCGLVAGETYVHERFLGSLRAAIEHSAVVVVVGDGGCTERPTRGVSDYLCRLWTRYELRAALRMRKLAYASEAHRTALLRGRGLGIQSNLFWADPSAEVPAPVSANPRRIALLDMITLLNAWFAIVLFSLTCTSLVFNHQNYIKDRPVRPLARTQPDIRALCWWIQSSLSPEEPRGTATRGDSHDLNGRSFVTVAV